MATGRERSNANLRRGNTPKEAIESRRREAALTDSMYRDADDSPYLVVRRLFAAASRAAERGYDRWNRTGQRDPHLIEVSREARQLADRYLEVLREQGEMARADEVLAAMDSRLETTASRLEQIFVPALDPATRPGRVLDDAGEL